jgi:hypothetical protein
MSMLIHGRRLLLPLATTALLSFTFSPASAFTVAGPSLAAVSASSAFEKVWYDEHGHWHNPAHPHPAHMYVNPEAQHVYDPYVHHVHGPRHCFVDPTDPSGQVHCHPHGYQPHA